MLLDHVLKILQACASTLANYPGDFSVTIMEADSHTGGQATSIPLDESTYGSSWLNDGVQGGSGIFRHTFHYFRQMGYEPCPVKLQVSFGKGRESFWTNVFPSPLVDQLSGDIRRFGKISRYMKYLMPILGLLPIKITRWLFRLSDDFTNKMLFPLVALFLGTGNQTPNVPSVFLERLFNDAQMRLWDYDPHMLLANLPTMFTFPNLSNFYRDWAADLRARGVDVRLSCSPKILERNKNAIVLQSQTYDTRSRQPLDEPVIEVFDELVLCCPADESKKLLGRLATPLERFFLGGVKFYDDLTITHSDSKYFQQNFESQYQDELAQSSSEECGGKVAFAKQQSRCLKDGWQGFRPMYFTHSVSPDPQNIEMGFDCTNYQHQFREKVGFDKSSSQKQHVYQTIFLDSQKQNLWTWDNIHKSKIIDRKWWHQFAHRWQHYFRVVPGMMFINGKNHTHYAGSWTMVVSASSYRYPGILKLIPCRICTKSLVYRV